jgi:hypothetical protein
MKLTIIPSDASAYKDGLAYHDLDISAVPSGVHALQFNTATNKGHIEFVADENGDISAPQQITQLPDWANTVFAKWDDAKAAEQLAIQLAAQLAEQLALENAAK